MRKDKITSLEKVAGAIAKNPTGTTRDIAKSAGVGKGTVSRASITMGHKWGIEQGEKVIKIADSDLNIVDSIQRITEITLPKIENGANTGDKFPSIQELGILHQVAEKSQKRYSFLKGENSDSSGAEKERVIVVKDKDTAEALSELIE